MLFVLDEAQHREPGKGIARALRKVRDRALRVAMRAAQHAIQNRDGPGAGGRGGITYNTDTHTDDEQPQGGGDDLSGEVKRDVCLGAAIDGHSTVKLCWRKHDTESIEQDNLKAAGEGRALRLLTTRMRRRDRQGQG